MSIEKTVNGKVYLSLPMKYTYSNHFKYKIFLTFLDA
jgi:hypothetical protein